MKRIGVTDSKHDTGANVKMFESPDRSCGLKNKKCDLAHLALRMQNCVQHVIGVTSNLKQIEPNSKKGTWTCTCHHPPRGNADSWARSNPTIA